METNEIDSETERVTGMLKWTFAAMMILGLSTISPAAQAPIFLYNNPAAENTAPAPELVFETINGVAMDGDLKEVLAVLGEPTERTTDELLGTEEVHYPEMTVGLYEGLVDYVVIPASAGSVRLGDTEALLELAQLRELLGEPDLVAEDGLVYVQGPLALKLFTDGEGSVLSTLEVFWAASS